MFQRALIVVGGLGLLTAATAYSTYPPLGFTGSPQDGISCIDCHGTYNENQRGYIAIQPSSFTYSASQVIDVRVLDALSDPAIDKWGFECRTERISDGSSQGTFTGDGGVTTDVATQGGVQYIFQADNFFPQPDSGWWNFTWTAPATDVGAIGIYCAGVLSNSGQGNNNDYVVTSAETLNPSFIGIGEGGGVAEAFSLDVPGTFNGEVSVAFSVAQGTQVELSLFDAVGREAAVLFDGYAARGKHVVRSSTAELPVGLYFVRLRSATRSLVVPMVRLR